MSNILKYQNPSSPLLINRINQSKANFVKRLLDPNRKSIQNWVNPLSISTHKLGWATEDTKQGAFVYPEVQEIDGELIDFTHPSHRRSEGINSAIERRDTVRMTPEQAEWFTENYKQYYPSFKKGGRIHIKKKNRGKFTEYCGGKVTEECIAKGKKSKDPKIRKRATFAANARKWKHENGGILKAQEGTGNGFWSKLWNAVKAGGMAARDAKLGAIGAQQVRDLYSEGKNQEAQDLAKQYAKANTTGIALAGGAASTGLLGDLMITGATTSADTFIDGDVDNFGTNLLTNVSADLLGNGVGKIVNFKNFLKNNGDLQKWLFGKGSLKNKFSDGKFIYNEFVNPDWRKYELANKMILSKINRDWGLQYLEPEDYLKKVGNSRGNTNPNTKTVYIKKAKFPWANQHTVGHEINHVIQQGYIPSSWNNIILNNQSFGRVPKKSIYPTVRYGEYTTVDPNYADTFPSLNDIRLRSENAPDSKQILWYSSPDEIDSEFAGGLFEGYNPKESIENIQQKWNLAGFSIDDYEIENIDKLFREIDVNNKQRILLNGKRKNPILNSTKSYLHTVNESSDDIDNIVKNINSGIKIGTGASIGTSVGLYNLLNDNE